jgi:hypothetical protein
VQIWIKSHPKRVIVMTALATAVAGIVANYYGLQITPVILSLGIFATLQVGIVAGRNRR